MNIFKNYNRQRYPIKELIIVINNDNIQIELYKELAMKYKNVQIYQLPEKKSLGKCLNYAVMKSQYSYVAKFDDDDYYAPYYLTCSIPAFNRSNADIIGKRSHFMYLQGSNMLILRFHLDEYKYTSILPGATLIFKRKVFRKVQFADQSIGEDTQFCLDSIAKGYKIYSTDKYNFAAVRRKNSENHTWIINDKELLNYVDNIRFPHVRGYEKFVRRRPEDL